MSAAGASPPSLAPPAGAVGAPPRPTAIATAASAAAAATAATIQGVRSPAPRAGRDFAGAPHSGQNLARADRAAPHLAQAWWSVRGPPPAMQKPPVDSAPQAGTRGGMGRAWVEARRLFRGVVLPALAAALALGAGPSAARAQTGAIAGVVRSAQTAEPLAAVVVSVLRSGLRTTGDSAGAFAFAEVRAGSWQVEVRSIGYRVAVVPAVVRVGQRTVLDVRLQPAPVALPAYDAVARSADRERFEDQAQVSTRSLDIGDIRAVPGLAESDLLRTVQLMPGVVARNDFSVGLNVRGGDADQNLVLLDGQVVFNPFHLGGLVSTFADDAVEGLEFLAGGFPARYGGRLASVLDISQRDGNPERVHGSAAVSLLSSKLSLNGPLPGGAGTWIIAGRRTYADKVVSALSSEEFPYHFQDLVGRVTLPRVLGGVLSATAFTSGDYFHVVLSEATTGQASRDFRFNWGNGVAGLTYQRSFGPSATISQRAGASRFFADIDVEPGLYFFRNRVQRLGLAGDLEVRAGAHALAAGYVLERHSITYHSGAPGLEMDFGTDRMRPAALEIYAEDQWRPAPWLLLRPGARLTSVGSARFRRAAPRFSAKAFLSSRTAVSAAVGRYYQYVQSLRNEEIPITLFEFWIGADSTLPVASADHAILGLEHWVSDGLQVMLEGYWKGMRDLADENPADDPEVSGDEFRRARGNAYGMDFYVRKTTGRLTGWIAYTLGWVTRATEDGDSFAPAQDRRHNVNVVANTRGPLGAELTLRFGYGSPLPYTAVAGQWIHRYYDPGRNLFLGVGLEPYRTGRNAERYPAYTRVDMSARWTFRWLGARWHPTMQLLNATARTNVFVYFFDYGQQPPVRRGLSQFPFMPTLGLEVVF